MWLSNTKKKNNTLNDCNKVPKFKITGQAHNLICPRIFQNTYHKTIKKLI